MDNDNIQFVEPQYGAKDQKSFPGMMLEHFDRILKLTTVEWHGGYWNKKSTKNGVDEIYVPNSIESFHNALRGLYTPIKYYLTGNFKEKISIIVDEINKLEKIKDKLNKDSYNQKKIELSWLLFEELSGFFKELNYFKPKTMIAGLELIQNE